eukprot:TRINITY_DN28839_c0_g1_i1.p1 TRINITY_DN28839_c0_g1~~TRINITY_DN28839_c0_g1_i1.p1  ORF type:complete len:423 (+),score=117.83 TRINITY_DN28839_c0_g1_i1:60-1328(+)
MVCDRCGEGLSPPWHLFWLTMRYDHPFLGMVLWSGKRADGSDDMFGRVERFLSLLAEFWCDALVTFVTVTVAFFPESYSDWAKFTLSVAVISQVVKTCVVGPAVLVMKRSPVRDPETQKNLQRCSCLVKIYLLVVTGAVVLLLVLTLSVNLSDAHNRAKECASNGGCTVRLFPAVDALPQLFGAPYTPSPAANLTVPAPGCPAQPNVPGYFWNDTYVTSSGKTTDMSVCEAFWGARGTGNEAIDKVSGYTHLFIKRFAKLSSSAAACTVSSDVGQAAGAFEIMTEDAETKCSFCEIGDPTATGVTKTSTLCLATRLTDLAGQICVCKAVEPTFLMIFIGGCLSQWLGWLLLDPVKGFVTARCCPCCLCCGLLTVSPAYAVAYEGKRADGHDGTPGEKELTMRLTQDSSAPRDGRSPPTFALA